MDAPIRVLYAEDDPRDADLAPARFALEQPAFEIEIVDTGEECWARLQQHQYDILLLDYHLPDMDGIDLLKRLVLGGSTLPVVMVTGSGDEDVVVQALRLGAIDYVSKSDDYLATLPAILRRIALDYRRRKTFAPPLAPPRRHVLYIERQQMDIDLTLSHFREAAPHLVVTVVGSCAEASQVLLGDHDFDLVMADLRMPDMSALDFFRVLKHRGTVLPFVIITGQDDEETAVAALKMGAADYIVKRQNYLTHLPYTIDQAIARFQLDLTSSQLRQEIVQRQQVEAALRENEERLARTIETMPSSLVIVASSGQIVLANQAAEKLLGLSRDDITGRTYNAPTWKVAAVDGGTFPDDRLPFAQVRQTDQAVYDVQHSIVQPDGARVILSINAAPLHDATGRFSSMVAVLNDITDRTRAAEAVRESEENYRSLFANMQEGVALHQIVYDANHQPIDYSIVEVNPAFEDILGITREQAVGQRATTLYGMDPAPFLEIYAEVAATGKPVQFKTDFPPLMKQFDISVTSPKTGWFATIFTDITERKRAEEALRESEWRNRMVTEMTTDYIFIADVDQAGSLKLRWASDSMVRLTGRTIADALTPDMWKSIVHPDDAPAFFGFIERLLASGESGVLECRTTIKSGLEHWIQIDAQPHRDENGAVTFIIGAIKDVSERKRAEETTRSLAKFPGENQSPVFRLNADGLILYANEASQVLLHEWQCAVGGPAPQMWRDLCAQALAARSRHTLDCEYAGEVYAFVITPIVEFNYVNLYAINITIRKQAEEAVRRSAQRLEILHHIDRAVLAAQSPEAIAETALLRLRDLIPFQLGGIVLFDAGETLVLAAVPNDGPSFYSGLRLPAEPSWIAALQHGQPILFPDLWAYTDPSIGVDLLKAAGLQSVVSVPLLVQGQLIGTLNLVANARGAFKPEHVDIAVEVADQIAVMLRQARLHEQVQRHASELEIRVAERTHELTQVNTQLAAANVRLAELDQLKSKFVSDVSHELRTPVTSLGLYLDLMNRGKPEKRDHYLLQASTQMARLRGLIDEILDLSRLDRQQQVLNLELLDLNEVVALVVDEQQPLAEESGLELMSWQAAESLKMRGDHGQILRAIRNLVTNAIKYTRTGSVQVTLLDDGERVGVQVSDTGIGISPEDLPHVFDRFYRGRQVAQSTIPGTGLGLALVKEIAEAHGGTVEVESQLGVGSTFRLWLKEFRGVRGDS